MIPGLRYGLDVRQFDDRYRARELLSLGASAEYWSGDLRPINSDQRSDD
jgi:hypothetical protein